MDESSMFVDAATEEERKQAITEYPEIMEDWDPEVGDRMNKICFIGRHMDKEALIAGLDSCLVDWHK